jgi:hypothetical protein
MVPWLEAVGLKSDCLNSNPTFISVVWLSAFTLCVSTDAGGAAWTGAVSEAGLTSL